MSAVYILFHTYMLVMTATVLKLPDNKYTAPGYVINVKLYKRQVHNGVIKIFANNPVNSISVKSFLISSSTATIVETMITLVEYID